MIHFDNKGSASTVRKLIISEVFSRNFVGSLKLLFDAGVMIALLRILLAVFRNSLEIVSACDLSIVSFGCGLNAKPLVTCYDCCLISDSSSP